MRDASDTSAATTLLHLATARRERARSMVIAGATAYVPAQARVIMRSMTESSRSAAEWAELSARHGDDERVRAILTYVRALADDVDDMAFTPPRLARVSARTLIVGGDRDPLYPARIFLEMYEAIERAQLWIVPGAGHEVAFTEPTFAERALAFLDADRRA